MNEPLTPDQFLAKFPTCAQVNRNCLEDMACPKCGNRRSFNVEVVSTAQVHDNGTDNDGGNEWDDTSACDCGECDHAGTVADFTIEGLDAALAEKLNAQ